MPCYQGIYLAALVCMYVLSLHPLGWDQLHLEDPGARMGFVFFELEPKPTGKDSADPNQH